MKGSVKVLAVAALAPLAGAFVIPTGEIEAQLGPVGDVTTTNDVNDDKADGPRTWLDAIIAERAAVDDSISDDSWGPLSLDDLASLGEDSLSSLEDAASSILDTALGAYAGGNRHHHHPPPTEGLTIWEILEKSEHGTTFASLIKEYDDLVEILSSTDKNHTVFVPTDAAFDKIRKDHHEKPSREDLEDFLRNHIVPGNVEAKQMWHRNTLPTLLKEKALGGDPQRLRVRFGLRGVNINVHSRVVVADVPAKNGIVHAVETVITRPAPVGKTLAANPPVFSTLLYAYTKTNYVREIHRLYMEGSTVFAPSNDAFAKLGHAVTGYLFNNERGLKILTAILKYNVVANTTLYTDAAYGKLSGGVEEKYGHGRSTHYELKTLYDGKGIGVDIWRWGGWTSVKVNGHIGVVFADGVASNGVLHVVDRVPLPPCPRGGDDEITIESLEERFRGLLGEDEQQVFEDL